MRVPVRSILAGSAQRVRHHPDRREPHNRLPAGTGSRPSSSSDRHGRRATVRNVGQHLDAYPRAGQHWDAETLLERRLQPDMEACASTTISTSFASSRAPASTISRGRLVAAHQGLERPLDRFAATCTSAAELPGVAHWMRSRRRDPAWSARWRDTPIRLALAAACVAIASSILTIGTSTACARVPGRAEREHAEKITSARPLGGLRAAPSASRCRRDPASRTTVASTSESTKMDDLVVGQHSSSSCCTRSLPRSRTRSWYARRRSWPRRHSHQTSGGVCVAQPQARRKRSCTHTQRDQEAKAGA